MSIYSGNNFEDKLKILEIESTSLKKIQLIPSIGT